MLEPTTDKFIIEFSNEFFSLDSVKTYTNYLYNSNGPIKDFQTHFYESILSLTVPGITAQPTQVNGLNNLRGVGTNQGMGTTSANMTETAINRSYVGTTPLDELFNSKTLNLTMRNTYLNWAYCYQLYRGHFARNRTVEEFRVIQTIFDTANIPMFQFIYSDCYISGIPDLEFQTNTAVRDVRTIDIPINFNKFDVQFLLPEFDTEINNRIIIF